MVFVYLNTVNQTLGTLVDFQTDKKTPTKNPKKLHR